MTDQIDHNDDHKSPWRPGRYWRLADRYAGELLDCLSAPVRSAAMATCRLTLRDKESTQAGGAWGNAVLMRMQTFGEEPKGVTTQVRCDRNWITLQSADAVNVVLGCFGLTLDDVYATFGTPVAGECKQYDLFDLLAGLMPDMIDDAILNEPAIVAAA